MHYKDCKQLLGTELPIIQAPMAGVQDSVLAIAVSEAGGLGSLPCAMLSPEQLVAEIKLIKAASTKPVNLNFFCHEMPAFDEQKQLVWQARLKPYFDKLGIEAASLPAGASRTPFNHATADLIEAFKPEIISFHFGLPGNDLMARIKSWGTKVLSTATTLKEALWLEAQGVDGVIAQGLEAGGHRGMFLSADITTQVGLAALVPQIVSQVKVPVVAAGGIADAKGVQAALLLGASAVQVGTAYLLCNESNTSQLHRAALKSTEAEHTALTNIFTGRPARGIVNQAIKELGYISETAPDFPYASIEMGKLRAAAEKNNSADFSPLWSGQNPTGCKEISAGELTRQLAEF
ncbi:NAD(P)H-dependent flavin oxidoreductase [Marinospirillum insulare]|uniref:Propionate 3-nitronate monooxygenase n=1 Tax=Marinospirillum insulare TaxID=217169 RepID=A0ABQ6A316_9GAMM|nr:nitronate monooxygenase [Marinospirillum insulare]GLR64475.1 2-nitropropane dioxygenase [Marinospirillum insulare]